MQVLASVTFQLSEGSRAAMAVFDANGSQLVITLSNISAADVLEPNQVLTALFFNIGNNAETLTPISAKLTPGSHVNFGADGGGNVGGEWAYKKGFLFQAISHGFGISTAGFGIFGQANFNGPNLDAQTAVQGHNYGLIPVADNPLTGNSEVTSGHKKAPPLIQSSVTFRLNGFSSELNEINGVLFQYGTAPTDPSLQVSIPEPSQLILGLVGLGLIVGAIRRRKSR